MADNETHYNAIVGVIDGELAVLEYTFEDSEILKVLLDTLCVL